MNPRHRRSWFSRCSLVARDALRRRRRPLLALLSLGVIVAGGASLGFGLIQDSYEEPIGLRGIWPEFPPPSLSVDSFSQLDGRWASWSEAAAIDVAELYSLADADIETQRARLAAVERRVRVLETALRDPAYSMIREELTSVRAPLELRADVFRASLALVTEDARPAAKGVIPEARVEFKNAVSRVRSDLNFISNGSAWFPYLQLETVEKSLGSENAAEDLEALADRLDPAADDLADEQAAFLERASLRNLAKEARRLAALSRIAAEGTDPSAVRERLGSLIESIDYHEESPTAETAAAIRRAGEELRLVAGPAAEPLAELVRKQYMNYNLRLVADARFLGKIVSTTEVQRGPVRDYFMGASIYGNQKTRASANLAFIPSADRARFKLVLDGVANSRTNAFAEKATVSSVGTHYFHATKPISFDGDRFSFGPARVSVNPNIRHTGISTKYDHIFFGLFKGLIQRRAMREANSRIPQGRAHAAEEMRAKLLPEFNGEVEGNFSELNAELAGFDSRLARENLTPSAERVRTTGDRFLFDAAVRGNSELSGSPPNVGSTRGVGFTLQVHQSLLNNMADRWDLAGKSMTEAEVRGLLEDWFSQILGRDVSFEDESGKPADKSVLTFDESDPIRFEADGGALRLILRAGIETEDGREVPTQVVEVPLEIRVENGRIHLERGTVIVSPLERPRNRALQITRAGIMRKKIEQAIEPGSVDGTLTVQRPGQNPFSVHVQRIEARAGWLTVFGI